MTATQTLSQVQRKIESTVNFRRFPDRPILLLDMFFYSGIGITDDVA